MHQFYQGQAQARCFYHRDRALYSASKSRKTSAAAAGLLDRAPGAVAKLKAKGWEVKCLTVTEIFAVALRYFNTPLKKGLKDSAVLQLRTLINT